jgi:hypothetical protein
LGAGFALAAAVADAEAEAEGAAVADALGEAAALGADDADALAEVFVLGVGSGIFEGPGSGFLSSHAVAASAVAANATISRRDRPRGIDVIVGGETAASQNGQRSSSSRMMRLHWVHG